MTQKEAEYVSLSRDTTETDLKQRREIRAGSAHHIDQVYKIIHLLNTVIIISYIIRLFASWHIGVFLSASLGFFPALNFSRLPLLVSIPRSFC